MVNIAGFLDFNTKFVADSFEKCGAECRISSINLPELERLRISPTEMRSTNIARVLENDKTLETLIRELAGKVSGFDSVALPAVFRTVVCRTGKKAERSVGHSGMADSDNAALCAGIRAQQQLRRSFEALGGVYMLGDTVVKATSKAIECRRYIPSIMEISRCGGKLRACFRQLFQQWTGGAAGQCYRTGFWQ